MRLGLITLILTAILSGPVTTGQCRPLVISITMSIEDGTKFCRILRIPQPWNAQDRELGSGGLYRRPNGGDGILFSLEKPGTASNIPVSQKYWIDLGRGQGIRLASDAEWAAGTDIPFLVGTGKVVMSGAEPKERPIRKDSRVVSFNGHQFPKSGDIWSGAYVAPGNKYVALRSFNGWSDAGRASRDGSLFIDVYDTADGKRLAAIQGSWCDYVPESILEEVKWISDRDLFLPFGDKKRDVLACRFDAHK
jgi:hypothetical protein